MVAHGYSKVWGEDSGEGCNLFKVRDDKIVRKDSYRKIVEKPAKYQR